MDIATFNRPRLAFAGTQCLNVIADRSFNHYRTAQTVYAVIT